MDYWGGITLYGSLIDEKRNTKGDGEWGRRQDQI